MRGLRGRSDEELWSSLSAGRDCLAFAELCRRHQRQVQERAWRVTGCEDLAQDVTQEVFLRMWEAPHRFQPARGSLRSFLLTECHGRAIDRLRSEESRNRRNARWATTHEDGTASAEELALRALQDRGLLELLSALPVEQRDALLLAFIEGLPYRSVATTLDVPEGTAKARIRTGLKSLRAVLERTSTPDRHGPR